MTYIFDRLVTEAADRVARGRVTTFREVARALGDPRAARAVAESISRLKEFEEIAWHRFVASDGTLGAHAAEKAKLLAEEGVPISGARIRGLKTLLVSARELKIQPLLHRMRWAQEKLARVVSLEDELDTPELAAGVDVSYKSEGSSEVGSGACVVVDRSLEVVERRVVRLKAPIPYIPTYLGFREMRFITSATRGFDFDVLFVDGHGIAHPASLGEASHAGVVLDLPSIGVAKRRLVGLIEGGVITIAGRTVGYEVRRPSQRAVYVSPGNKISVESSLRIARMFWGKGRQPSPLEFAHTLARKSEQGVE